MTLLAFRSAFGLNGPALLASETWTGANGAAWPAQWTITGVTGVGVADIQNNTGRMFSDATSYGLGPCAYLSGMAATADVDLLVTFTTAAAVTGEAGYFRVGVRSDGTFTDFAPNTGYSVEFCTSSDGAALGYFQLFKGGVGANLTAPSMFAFAPSTSYKLRLRVVGNLIRAKWWLASASEPIGWGLETTDTSFPSAGKVALSSIAGFQAVSRGVYWDDLVVATADGAISWQSEVSTTALQLGWILGAGTSVRAVAATDAAFTSPIYGNTITRPTSGWCTSRVTGLTANTLYYTGVEVDGVLLSTHRGQYRTLKTGLVASKVVTSSCISDSLDGLVYARITQDAPDFFVQQGDIHYWDATTDTQWRTGFAEAVTGTGMARLLATTSMAYFWNNHDWGGDGSHAGSPVASFAPAAVRELSGGTVYPNSVGLWRTWVHAGVRYINMDPYAHRSPETDADTSAKTMLGTTQKAWLLNLFQTATEQAIVVFSGFPHYPSGSGRWASYGTERTEIGNAIAALPTAQRNKIVFVGGDSHTIVADDGTNAMWGRPTLNASPMMGTGNAPLSGTWNITNQASDSARGYYSRLTFTPSGSDLNMTWDAVRDDGTVMATWSTSFPTTSSATATGSITLGGAPAARAESTAAGSITLAGTPTARATASTGGAITLGGAPAATAPASAGGSITLDGTATGTQPGPSATGSITLGGSATAPSVATTGGGQITLAGAPSARASVASAGGQISLTGTPTARAPATTGGLIVLGGAPTARVPATAAGLITLSGLANGAAAIPPRYSFWSGADWVSIPARVWNGTSWRTDIKVTVTAPT